MNAALELLHAERDAVAATLASQETYVAACKGEIFKALKNIAANRERQSELQAAIERIN